MRLSTVRRSSLLTVLPLGAFAAFGAACGGAVHEDATEVSEEAFTPAPRIEILDVVGLQPGWLRVKLRYAFAPAGADFGLETSCGPKLRTSVAYVDRPKRLVFVDVKQRYDRPSADLGCTITSMTAWMGDSLAAAVATATRTIPVGTEPDGAHLDPARAEAIFGPVDRAEIDLGSPRRHVAYPGRLIAIQTPWRTAIAEVELLPSRGSVGLRWLTSYMCSGTYCVTISEWGGGAEILGGYGLDVERRGVVRETTALQEIANPGHAKFPTGDWQPSFLLGTPQANVYPSPPRTSEALYLSEVLDNRLSPREHDARDAVDVVFDLASKKLLAKNGAKLRLLEHPPLQTVTKLSPPLELPRAVVERAFARGANADTPGAYAAVDALRAQVNQGALLSPVTATAKMREQLAGLRTQPLGAAVAPTEIVQRDPNRPPSPQELAALWGLPVSESFPNGPPPPTRPLGGQPSPSPNGKPFAPPTTATVLYPGAACAISADGSAFTRSITACGGASSPSGCPTPADPFVLESIPAAPGDARTVSVNGTMTPLRAGRANTQGTCGTHAELQATEGALNRFMDDEGRERFVFVDGLPIGVPESRIALSHGASLTHLYTSLGTREGRGSDWSRTEGDVIRWPQFPEAVWPFKEEDPYFTLRADEIGPFPGGPGVEMWEPWASVLRCRDNYWDSGFCVGKGSAPSGMYSAYSRMALDVGKDPFKDQTFSLAHSYSGFTLEPIPHVDFDAAVQDVVATLRSGLPVRMDYITAIRPATGLVPTPVDLPVGTDLGWYLPPEVAGCDFARYEAVPGSGHAVTIVAAVLRGNPFAPNPFRSYFVIMNNWGKWSGRSGYYAINLFAAHLLTTRLYTVRLDRTCASSACAHH